MREREHVFAFAYGTGDFPSFSEGLSLRAENYEAYTVDATPNFPSFSEGLSLRGFESTETQKSNTWISLPFRRDFH